MDQTRRALLRSAVPLALTAGIAGCSTLSGDDGTATDSGPGTETATQTATSGDGAGRDDADSRWLFPPSVIDRDHYAFLTSHPSAMLEFADELPQSHAEGLRGQMGLGGFDTTGSLRSIHRMGSGVSVYDGPFERDPLVSELTDAGFSETGEYQGFDRYEPENERVVAIGDEQVLLVDLRRFDVSNSAADVTESAIDAYTGAGPRYQNENDDLSVLLQTLGSGEVRLGETGSTELDTDAAVAQGGRWRLGTDATDVVVAFVFESESATDGDAVEDWASAGPFGQTTPTVSTDGRVATARASVPTADLGPFQLAPSSDESQPPQVSFTFDYDDEAGTVTITHNGGDSVAADSLSIRGDGFADRDGADQTARGQWAGAVSGDDDSVVPGDSVVVGVTSSYQLFLLYTPESGAGATLASDSGPDA